MALFCSDIALTPQAKQQRELLVRQKLLGGTSLWHKHSAQPPKKHLGMQIPVCRRHDMDEYGGLLVGIEEIIHI